MEKKQKILHFILKIRKTNPNDFSDFMKNNKPDKYSQTKELICDWSDKKTYMILCRMLKFSVENGMMVEKTLEISSFKQSKWLKKCISFSYDGYTFQMENYDSYTFKQIDVSLDEPEFLDFSVLELSKLMMYEICYDKLQLYFGQENLELQYMDFDCFVLSIETQNIVKDLKNLENHFDFSNLNGFHQLFRNKNKKVVSKHKIESNEKIWIDEFV